MKKWRSRFGGVGSSDTWIVDEMSFGSKGETE